MSFVDGIGEEIGKKISERLNKFTSQPAVIPDLVVSDGINMPLENDKIARELSRVSREYRKQTPGLSTEVKVLLGLAGIITGIFGYLTLTRKD